MRAVAVVDSDTRQFIAIFEEEAIARFAAALLSRMTHRPLSLIHTELQDTLRLPLAGPPLARFLDGEEIAPTASVHALRRDDHG